MNAQGIDISFWQNDKSTPQIFDPLKARKMGASFVGIKVSQANYADLDYMQNWAISRRVLYRLPYHFLVWDVKPATQAETFWSLIEKDTWGLLPLVCDFEWWKVTPSNAMDILYNFTYRLKQLSDPLPQGIYTALSYWLPNGSVADYWKEFALWLCDITGPIEVPKPWAAWDFHQYTFKLNGPEWGVESLDLDGDIYNGTLDEMIQRYNLPALDGEPIPDVPETNDGLTLLVKAGALNVRSGPGTQYPILGKMPRGTLVVADNIAGTGAWVEFEPGRWACVQLNGMRYMEPV